MFTAIIIDDEVQGRETLERMLVNFCPEVKILGKGASVSEAIQLIDDKSPQVVFLDIEMPGGNGFTLLEHYEVCPFEVIFTTAHDLYAINAIKFAALDYLLKPVNIRELQEAVKRAEQKLGNQAKSNSQKRIETLKSNLSHQDGPYRKIALPNSEGIDFIEVGEIVRVEAERSYSSFHLKGKKQILVSRPLSDFESMLEQCNFFRVHKSHMINLDHLKKYIKGKGGYVIMDDNSHVDVSVRKKESLLQRIGYKS